MKRANIIALVTMLFCVGIAGHALGADVTEAELMQAAIDLGHQYDANYAVKNPAAMAALYTSDGVLVSPAGPIIRGREALKSYYSKRFASGASGHAIKVLEVHIQGNGGYGILLFSVTAPRNNGLHREHGSIVAIYQRDLDGWHFRLVEASVPESAEK